MTQTHLQVNLRTSLDSYTGLILSIFQYDSSNGKAETTYALLKTAMGISRSSTESISILHQNTPASSRIYEIKLRTSPRLSAKKHDLASGGTKMYYNGS